MDQGNAWLRLSLRDDEGWELLINGRGRWPGVWGDPLFTWLEQKLPLPAGYFSQLLVGSVWDVPSLIRYGVYLGLAWVGFWGWFGWLTRLWPWWVYGGAAVVSVLAAWGIMRRLILGQAGPRVLGPSPQEGAAGAREGHWAEDGGIVLFALAAVGWMGVLVVLPMLGQDWQPQGRYVFPALVPLAVLMWMGWEVWVPRRWRGWLGVGVVVGLLVLNGLGWWVV